MDFDHLLKNADRSDTRDVIGLAIYYLEEVMPQDSVSVGDISNLIEQSRIQSPSKSSLSAHIRYMKEDEEIKNRDGGYILTHSGLEKYGEKVGVGNERSDEAKFIENIHIDDEFYDSLISDINESYQAGIDEATLVLSRKLVENLLIDLLRGKYGHSGGNIELFYDTNNRQFRRFSTLVENLNENMEDFEYYSDRMDDDIIPKIKELKGGGDASAHSIEVSPSGSTMNDYQSKADVVVDILSYTLRKVRNANGQ